MSSSASKRFSKDLSIQGNNEANINFWTDENYLRQMRSLLLLSNERNIKAYLSMTFLSMMGQSSSNDSTFKLRQNCPS